MTVANDIAAEQSDEQHASPSGTHGTKRINVVMTEGLHKRIGHAAIDDGLPRAHLIRNAMQLYLDVREVLPELRSAARRSGQPIGEYVRDLVNAR